MADLNFEDKTKEELEAIAAKEAEEARIAQEKADAEAAEADAARKAAEAALARKVSEEANAPVNPAPDGEPRRLVTGAVVYPGHHRYDKGRPFRYK